MISVKGLYAGYRSGFRRTWLEVLQGVDFEVERGSVTGYLGINGSGKTTTIKVLVGVNPPSKGQVFVGGHPAGTAASQYQLGYFPEAPYFYEGLTGLELLTFLARLHGLGKAERTRRGEELLERVGLKNARDMLIRGFSKGMRQRLGLAQALVHDPQVLILDEPLDGLDPMGRLHVRGLIADQGAQGKTIFFSSHVLSDVEAISDHLVVLSGGKIAYQGSVGGLSTEEEPRIEIHVTAFEGDGLAAFAEALDRLRHSLVPPIRAVFFCEPVADEVADRVFETVEQST